MAAIAASVEATEAVDVVIFDEEFIGPSQSLVSSTQTGRGLMAEPISGPPRQPTACPQQAALGPSGVTSQDLSKPPSGESKLTHRVETRRRFEKFEAQGTVMTVKIYEPPERDDVVSWLENTIRELHALTVSGGKLIYMV